MSDRMQEEMPEKMSERMLEEMPERMSEDILQSLFEVESNRICQIEHRQDCQEICQTECRKECQKMCQKYCQEICKECQTDCEKRCQKECQKDEKSAGGTQSPATHCFPLMHLSQSLATTLRVILVQEVMHISHVTIVYTSGTTRGEFTELVLSPHLGETVLGSHTTLYSSCCQMLPTPRASKLKPTSLV